MGGSDDEAALTIRCWAGAPHHRANSRGVAVASTEQDKRPRAELAQELGFYPASLDPAQDPPEVRTPAGGRTPRIRRSPWPCPGGRPLRVSRDVNGRRTFLFLRSRRTASAVIAPSRLES